jgi:hypothetical protein
MRIYPTMSATIRCNSALVSVPPWGIADRGDGGENRTRPSKRPRSATQLWLAKMSEVFENVRANFEKKVMIKSLELENNRAQ